MNENTREYLSGNGNGHPEKNPSERAWDTARQKAREQGQTVRDEEIRCIKSKTLSAWAKVLFWILSKVCWESSPFLHNKRIGSICITGSQLKKYFGFAPKRLYAQNKKVKDKAGNVVTTRRTPGAIEELVSLGFIWTGRKEIKNIPFSKWPNIFNLTTLVAQQAESNLGLLEDVVMAEEDPAKVNEPTGVQGIFLPGNRPGPCQPLQNGLGKPGEPPLARTNGGTSPPPRAGLGKDQRGYLARTPVGLRVAPASGGGQGPTGVQAHSRERGLASPAIGASIKTSGLNSDSLTTDGEALPTEKQFQDWLKSLDGQFPSRLRDLEKAFTKKLALAQSPEARTEWNKRLAVVRDRLLGGPVQDKPQPKPVRADQKPALSFEQQKKAWEKAMKSLPASLQTKSRGRNRGENLNP